LSYFGRPARPAICRYSSTGMCWYPCFPYRFSVFIITLYAGRSSPAASVGVQQIIFIVPCLNCVSIRFFCLLVSPAWWNAIPFSVHFASLWHCLVGGVSVVSICFVSVFSCSLVVWIFFAISSAVFSELSFVGVKISACFCCLIVCSARFVSGDVVILSIFVSIFLLFWFGFLFCCRVFFCLFCIFLSSFFLIFGSMVGSLGIVCRSVRLGSLSIFLLGLRMCRILVWCLFFLLVLILFYRIRSIFLGSGHRGIFLCILVFRLLVGIFV